MFAVLGSNIEWHWTPNSYLASLIAAGIAYLATVALNALFLLGRCKRPLGRISEKNVSSRFRQEWRWRGRHQPLVGEVGLRGSRQQNAASERWRNRARGCT